MLAVVLIFIFSGWLDESSGMMLAIAFVLSMNVLTTFSYDQFSDWETFALTMPISRLSYVTSKFALGAILSLVGTVLAVDLLRCLSIFQLKWLSRSIIENNHLTNLF